MLKMIKVLQFGKIVGQGSIEFKNDEHAVLFEMAANESMKYRVHINDMPPSNDLNEQLADHLKAKANESSWDNIPDRPVEGDAEFDADFGR